MVKASVEFAKPSDVPELAAQMREADALEIWRASRSRPDQAVRWSFAASSLCWTGRIDDQMVCMFGVAPLNMVEGIGAPWMLGTDLIHKHPRIFLDHCRECVAQMFGQYTMLHNHVDAENTKAIRWLKWLGFEIHDPEPFGVFGMPFHHFELRLPCVNQPQ